MDAARLLFFFSTGSDSGVLAFLLLFLKVYDPGPGLIGGVIILFNGTLIDWFLSFVINGIDQ